MTDVQICNFALSRLGLNKITSLSSSSAEAVECNLHYEQTKNEVLREHDWNCAVAYANLAQSAADNATDYEYLYTLPMDCLRVLEAVNDGAEDYSVFGGYLATGSETCTIRYISKIEDPNRFDATIVEAIALKLATKIAFRLTQSKAKEEQAYGMYMQALERARQIDQQEQAADAAVTLWEDLY